MIVDNAIYVDGHRTAEPVTLEETYEAVRNRRGVAWIGLYKPTEEEFSSVSEEFGLHGLAVEDATDAHQRPKLERYGNTLFVVLKPARRYGGRPRRWRCPLSQPHYTPVPVAPGAPDTSVLLRASTRPSRPRRWRTRRPEGRKGRRSCRRGDPRARPARYLQARAFSIAASREVTMK